MRYRRTYVHNNVLNNNRQISLNEKLIFLVYECKSEYSKLFLFYIISILINIEQNSNYSFSFFKISKQWIFLIN